MESVTVKKAEKKEKQALITIETNYVCESCRNAHDCTFPKNGKKRIFLCDEFHGYEPLLVNIGKLELTPPKTSNKEKAKLSSIKGLCSSCLNAGHCTFPKPESGVWYCDEYTD